MDISQENLKKLFDISRKIAYDTQQLKWDNNKTLVSTEQLTELRLILGKIKKKPNLKI